MSRAELWTGAALVMASLAILASAPAQYLGRQQDDLLYLIGSRSLLEGSFRLLTVPGAPPLTMINLGFPLLLAPLTLAFGDNFGVHQAFCALLLAACPWLLWFWLKRRLEPVAALLVAVAFAYSPLVLSQAGTVMSEPLFLVLTVALLWSLETGRPRGASAALFALTQTRLAGVALLPAAAAGARAKRRWSGAELILGPALAGLAAWTLWSRHAAGALQKTEELGLAYRGGLTRLWPVAVSNANFYLTSLGSCALPERLGGGRLGFLLGAAWVAAAAAGGRKLLKRDGAEPAVWALGGTAALHLVWPWQYERYWLMPLPLLLFAAAHGLGKTAARAALGVLVAGELLFHVPRWTAHRGPFETPELARTYAWLRANTAPSDILASALYVRDGFLAGRPAVPLPPPASAEETAADLRKFRARWVVRADGLDLGLTEPRTAVVAADLSRLAVLFEDRRHFRPAHEEPAERAAVYEVLP